MDSAFLCLSLAPLRSRSGLAPSALASLRRRSGGAPMTVGERCGKAASPAAVVSVIGEAREQRCIGLRLRSGAAEVAALYTFSLESRALEHSLRRDVPDP